MPPQRTGSRLSLGDQSLIDDLTDFCVAHYGAPEIGIVRAALRAYIDDRLANEPEMRKRFEEARRKRLGRDEPKVRLVRDNEDDG